MFALIIASGSALSYAKDDTEKHIDEIIHSHDGDDYYLGLGGRLDTERKIDYMILKYSTGLEGTRERKRIPKPEPEPEPEPDGGEGTTPEPQPQPEPEPDIGPAPSGPEHPAGEEWEQELQKHVDAADAQFTISIPDGLTEDDLMHALFDKAKYRTAEHGIFVDQIRYYIDNGTFGCTVEYPRSYEEIIEIKRKTSTKEEELYSGLGLGGLSEIEKMKAINDYVCDMVEYPSAKPYSDVSHTAYGAIFENSAVCDGYSRMTKYLCDDAGIDCYIVSGDVIGGGGHAWNIVRIDGKWYHLDVTWNDGCGDRSRYFLIPDSYLDGDRLWDKSLYPEVAQTPYVR